MSRPLSWLMLSGTALWQLSSAGPVDPTITPAALLPRQDGVGNGVDFMGSVWIPSESSWSRLECESGARWWRDPSGKYASCCDTTWKSCPTAIGCFQGVQTYTYAEISSSETIACTDNYGSALSLCNTAYVFENQQQVQSPLTDYFCGSGPKESEYSLYRSVATTATDKADASLTNSLPKASSTSSHQTAESKSSSKAWIAGVVVGPLLGLALVAAGVLLCLRRKKKKNAQAPHHGVATMAPVNPSQPPTGVTGYTDAKPQFQPAQGTYHNSQQEQAYPQQGAFSPPQVSPPVSPAPQYAYQAPYNTSSSPPNAPYTQDVKHAAHGGAAELGGSNVIVPAVSVSQGAELGGQNEKKTGR